MPEHSSKLWYDGTHPEVSIIILNYDKAALTIKCLNHLNKNTVGRRYEVIVVDNGSNPSDFSLLAEMADNFQLIRLPINRYFGEGNNIGVEASRGKYIVFLNNDAFVTENWLVPLIDTLEYGFAAGGAGPKFLYPDGRVQEAGAFVGGDGVAIQRGKFYEIEPSSAADPEIVDYCSAACFATTREIFDKVSGFDAIYEPAYYEDSDLCLKIASLDLFVYYCPKSIVHHIESATTSTSKQQLGLENIVETNRAKFLSRWGSYLNARDSNEAAILSQLAPARQRARASSVRSTAPVAVFYTPYDIIPGGGERYMLTAASGLIDTHRVFVASEARYSQYRLDHMARELSLDLTSVSLVTRAELPHLKPIDVFFHLDNHYVPSIPPQGRRNYLMCQFPFPISHDELSARWSNLLGYEYILVNSLFSRDVLIAKLNAFRFNPEIEVLSPPVPLSLSPTTEFPGFSDPVVILNIGRFFAGGHNKRHDVLIQAAKELWETGRKIELHLVGALHTQPQHTEHYLSLRRRAEGLPIEFHANASSSEVHRWLSRAALYWHATGFDVDPRVSPERCEHFGISVVEAMSAGCVPFVVANGGPPEFVREGETGFHYSTVDELVTKTQRLLCEPTQWMQIATAAVKEAQLFSEGIFKQRWLKISGGSS